MASFTAPNYRALSGLCGVLRIVTQAVGLGYRISAPAGLNPRGEKRNSLAGTSG